MKLIAALAAWGKCLLGKAKQHKHITVKYISFVTLAVALSGFFYCIFLTSKDSIRYAYESNGPILSTFGNLTEKVQAKEKIVDSILNSTTCNLTLPQASIASPTLTVYKLEQMCNQVSIDEKVAQSPEKQEMTEQEKQRDHLVKDLEPILGGTPMEQMIEPISEQQRIVAAYLVGIAKKESQLGKYAPSKDGADCFNYWGYKGKVNPVAGGYSCFLSPEEAVETVGARLEKFAIQQNRNTPAKMIIWKCGSSCETHSPESVAKWISDVSGYFFKLYQPQKTHTRS